MLSYLDKTSQEPTRSYEGHFNFLSYFLLFLTHQPTYFYLPSLFSALPPSVLLAVSNLENDGPVLCCLLLCRLVEALQFPLYSFPHTISSFPPPALYSPFFVSFFPSHPPSKRSICYLLQLHVCFFTLRTQSSLRHSPLLHFCLIIIM